jgi:hypothetical protein
MCIAQKTDLVIAPVLALSGMKHAPERGCRGPDRVCLFACVCALLRPCVLCWWACVCMSAWVGMREGEQHIVTAAPTTTESYKQT